MKFLIPCSLLIALGAHFRPLSNVTASEPASISNTLQEVTVPFAEIQANSGEVIDYADSRSRRPAELEIAAGVIWASGSLIVVACWLRRWRRIKDAITASKELTYIGNVPVKASSILLEPGVFGIFRPVVTFPDGITEKVTLAQLRMIVAHELCHIRRRDNLTAAVHMVVEAIFWFDPMVWWIGARLIDERERACDEEVTERSKDSKTYAEAILEVCKICVESSILCIPGITGADLRRRIVRIMSPRPAEGRSFGTLASVWLLALSAIVGPMFVGPDLPPPLYAQAATEDWQKKAGGHMEFDVASVKRSAPGAQNASSNIPLVSEEVFAPTGGLLTARNYPILQYIIFAYKLTSAETKTLQGQLPSWARTDGYDIEARATGNPTKDQYRLMMQSLLEDRFHLKVSTETRETEVLALVLNRPGQLGPRLEKHEPDVPCSNAAPSVSAGAQTVSGGFPALCGMLTLLPASAKGHFTGGARDVSMSVIANIFSMSGISGVDKPVVDETGLSGTYDFLIDFLPSDVPVDIGATPDASGPTFSEALKDQLGLKFQPTTVPIESFHIDHVERATSN